jgi:hypothetical protein
LVELSELHWVDRWVPLRALLMVYMMVENLDIEWDSMLVKSKVEK